MKSALIVAVFLCARGVLAADDQKAPVSSTATVAATVALSSAPACRLPEVKPLLLKARYSEVRYRRNVLVEKPLTLQERLWLRPGHLLLLEESACDDISARFEFGRKEDDADPFALRLSSAAASLRVLYLNPEATLDAKRLARIEETLESQAAVKREGPPPAEIEVCLEMGQKSCRTDISLKLVDGKLTVLYTEHP